MKSTAEWPSGRPAAVALISGAVGIHLGVCFELDNGALRVLHLAWHHQLAVDVPNDAWHFVDAAIDPIEAMILRGYCWRIDQARPLVPYAFGYNKSSIPRFDSLGNYAPQPGDVGLTCATFVLAVFDAARIPLIDVHTWRPRHEDTVIQQLLLEYLRTKSSATVAHIDAVRSQIGCARIRSEEVAVASVCIHRPVAFAVCEVEGALLASAFDQLSHS